MAHSSAPAVDFEVDRRELTGFCSRTLGSGFEAEYADQETLVRPWQHAPDASRWMSFFLSTVDTDPSVGRVKGPPPW